MIKKLHKACLKYDKWKSKHNPDYMPWVDPEKIKCPKIDWNDILNLDLSTISNGIDESQVKETDVDKGELDENND